MIDPAALADGRSSDGPIVAILRTHQEAAYAVLDLNRAGFALRKILIISNDYPSAEVTERIKHWPSLSSSWSTMGCLNAIGAGLDYLGMSVDDIGRCKAALTESLILVIMKGTPNEVIRARRACPEKGTLMRRIRT